MLEIVVGLPYLSGLIFYLTTAKCHYNQNNQELGVFMERIICTCCANFPFGPYLRRCDFAHSPEFNFLLLFVHVYRIFFHC